MLTGGAEPGAGVPVQHSDGVAFVEAAFIGFDESKYAPSVYVVLAGIGGCVSALRASCAVKAAKAVATGPASDAA